jgi:anti-sigma factor RsiW
MWRPQLDDDELVIRYLLGKASEQEQQRLEERYFGDDQFFEHLQALEEELIDAYVNGQLPADERKSFEEGFLSSPDRRQRVEFAKALLQSASREHAAQAARSGEKQSSWVRWPGFWRVPQPVMQLAFTAALVVFGLGGAWLLVQSLRLRAQLAQTVAQQTTLQREGQTLRAEVEQQRSLSQQLNGELERNAPSGAVSNPGRRRALSPLLS